MITAAFAAQYAMRPGFGEKPRIDAMFTTLPDRPGQHEPRRRSHAVEDAGLHDRNRRIPVLARDVLSVRTDAAETGVVDEDVEAPEIPSAGIEHRVDLVGIRDVHRVSARAHPEGGKLVGGSPGLIGVDLGDCDVGSRTRELLGDRAAEPASCPRHERDTPAQRCLQLALHAVRATLPLR
jgi:hypothetical protein